MGCFQGQTDLDVLYASTPTLVTIRILVLRAIAGNWTIKLLDVSTALSHAAMLGTVLIVPPKEFYPNQDCFQKLKQAIYGLKQSPAMWQSHFQSVTAKLGMKRFKTDANLYCHESRSLYVLCYVDDILVGGDDPLIDFTKTPLKEGLLKVEGDLTAGTSATFLGLTLRHNGGSIDISMFREYVDKLLDMYGMKNCKPVQNTGRTTTK